MVFDYRTTCIDYTLSLCTLSILTTFSVHYPGEYEAWHPSQIYIFGKPSTTRAILKAIERSEKFSPLSLQQYRTSLLSTMSSHVAAVNTSSRLIDALDDAFKT